MAIAIGIAVQIGATANACVVTKVKYLKDACPAGSAYQAQTEKPAAKAKVATTAVIVPAGHTTSCLKADFKYHSCAYGDQLPRYGHPADDDGPWWIRSGEW